MIKVLSNKKLAKVTIPLFFTVPPGSQIYDAINFLAFVDKKYVPVAKLLSELEDYEKVIEEVISGKDVDGVEFNVETVDEAEFEKKLETAFQKHKKLLDAFEVELSDFTFIVFKSEFFKGGFEGFKKPMAVVVFKSFDELLFIRSYLLWKLVNEKKIESSKAEVMLDYVILKYRLMIGNISKETFDEWIESYKKRDYWLLESFGDWIDKLEVLVDYNFNESVFEFLKKMG